MTFPCVFRFLSSEHKEKSSKIDIFSDWILKTFFEKHLFSKLTSYELNCIEEIAFTLTYTKRSSGPRLLCRKFESCNRICFDYLHMYVACTYVSEEMGKFKIYTLFDYTSQSFVGSLTALKWMKSLKCITLLSSKILIFSSLAFKDWAPFVGILKLTDFWPFLGGPPLVPAPPAFHNCFHETWILSFLVFNFRVFLLIDL